MTKNKTIQERARNLARATADFEASNFAMPSERPIAPRRVPLKSARIFALAALLVGALAGVIVGSLL